MKIRKQSSYRLVAFAVLTALFVLSAAYSYACGVGVEHDEQSRNLAQTCCDDSQTLAKQQDPHISPLVGVDAGLSTNQPIRASSPSIDERPYYVDVTRPSAVPLRI